MGVGRVAEPVQQKPFAQPTEDGVGDPSYNSNKAISRIQTHPDPTKTSCLIIVRQHILDDNAIPVIS